MFAKGTKNGVTVTTPLGAQREPVQAKAGVSVKVKNAQKKLKKNMISETIKSSIP